MPLPSRWWIESEPLVVASLGVPFSAGDLTDETVTVDLVEVRLDMLLEKSISPSDVLAQLDRHELLITARCPSEGGLGDLSHETRAKQLEAALPAATAIDIEVKNLAEMSPLVSAAKQAGTCVVGSFHDFEKTPDPEVYLRKRDEALKLGADIFKCAARLHDTKDLQTLIDLFDNPPLPTAAMGMGALGPASRVILAQRGSILNYGFLGATSTAPGQWPATLLKEAIKHSPRF